MTLARKPMRRIRRPSDSAAEREPEKWVPAYGYSEYEVSNFGRIRSIDRHKVTVRGQRRFYKGQLIAPATNAAGYQSVWLSGDMVRVNRIVLSSFVGPPASENLQANHINGIRDDNRLSNLEWLTPSENGKHSFSELGRVAINPSTGKFGKHHHRSKPVKAVPVRGGEPLFFEGLHDAQRKTGLDKSNISAACRGAQKTCGGYHWSFR